MGADNELGQDPLVEQEVVAVGGIWSVAFIQRLGTGHPSSPGTGLGRSRVGTRGRGSRSSWERVCS